VQYFLETVEIETYYLNGSSESFSLTALNALTVKSNIRNF